MTASGAQLPPRRLRPVVKVDSLTLVATLSAGRRSNAFLAIEADGTCVVVRSPVDGSDQDGFAEDVRRTHGLHVGTTARELADGQTVHGVLPAVAGVDLRTVLNNQAGQSLPLEISLRIAVGVAERLEHLQKENSVHGDLVPHHVFIGFDGSVHLLDAAGPKALSRSRLSTRAHYRSPEHVRSEPLSAASDVFSLGLLLFEMTTGQPAFTSAGADLEDDILRSRVPRPREIVGDGYPIELQLISRKLLRPTPAGRFPNGKSAKEALKLVATSRSDVSANSLAGWMQVNLPRHHDGWLTLMETPVDHETTAPLLPSVTPPSRAATVVEYSPLPLDSSGTDDDLQTLLGSDDVEALPALDFISDDDSQLEPTARASLPLSPDFDEGPETNPATELPLKLATPPRTDTQVDGTFTPNQDFIAGTKKRRAKPPTTDADAPGPPSDDVDESTIMEGGSFEEQPPPATSPREDPNKRRRALGASPTPRAPSALPSRVTPRPLMPPDEAHADHRADDTNPGHLEASPIDDQAWVAEQEPDTALHDHPAPRAEVGPPAEEAVVWDRNAEQPSTDDVAAAFDAAVLPGASAPALRSETTQSEGADLQPVSSELLPPLAPPTPAPDEAPAAFERDTMPAPAARLESGNAGSILDFEVPESSQDLELHWGEAHPIGSLSDDAGPTEHSAAAAAKVASERSTPPPGPSPVKHKPPPAQVTPAAEHPTPLPPVQPTSPVLQTPASATATLSGDLAPRLAEDLMGSLPELSAEGANAADTIQDASAEALFSTDDLARMQAAVADPNADMLPPEMQIFPAANTPAVPPPAPELDPGSSGVISGEAEISHRPQPEPYRTQTPPELAPGAAAPWRPAEPPPMISDAEQSRIPTKIVRDRVTENDAPSPAASLRRRQPPSLQLEDELEEDISNDLTPLVTPVMVAESMASLDDSPAADLVIPISDDELERSERKRSFGWLLLAAALILLAGAVVVGRFILSDSEVAVVPVPETTAARAERQAMQAPPAATEEDIEKSTGEPIEAGEAAEAIEVVEPIEPTEVFEDVGEEGDEIDEGPSGEPAPTPKDAPIEKTEKATAPPPPQAAPSPPPRTKRTVRRRRPPPPAPPPTKVIVKVKAIPKGTMVVLEDGRRLATPASVDVTDGPLVVRLEAPGYITQSLKLAAGQNTTSIMLKPTQAPADAGP